LKRLSYPYPKALIKRRALKEALTSPKKGPWEEVPKMLAPNKPFPGQIKVKKL